MPPIRFLLCLVLPATMAPFFGGCASVYEVTVDASSRVSGVARGGTSFAIDDRASAGLGPLRRNEIADSVRTALSAHGLHEAIDATAADIVVEINYGIDPPKVTQTMAQEIAFGRPLLPSERPGLPPEGVAREMMGYTQIVATEVTREKHVSICAREKRNAASEEPAFDLWRVHVVIANDSDDLRGHLPVLISAAMDYIGQTTEGEVSFTMRGDDEAIRFVQKGM